MIFDIIVVVVLGLIIGYQMLDNIQQQYGGDVMTWIFLAIGLLVGGGGGSAITWKIMDKKLKNQKPVVVKEEVAEKQQDVILQLTDLQLAKDICDLGNSLLCREILCLQFTRGVDSTTSGKQCEEISNLNNSIQIIDYCKGEEDVEKCLDVFWRRK